MRSPARPTARVGLAAFEPHVLVSGAVDQASPRSALAESMAVWFIAPATTAMPANTSAESRASRWHIMPPLLMPTACTRVGVDAGCAAARRRRPGAGTPRHRCPCSTANTGMPPEFQVSSRCRSGPVPSGKGHHKALAIRQLDEIRRARGSARRGHRRRARPAPDWHLDHLGAALGHAGDSGARDRRG
jgi:hypothetical protein